jgi:hypothetical protein
MKSLKEDMVSERYPESRPTLKKAKRERVGLLSHSILNLEPLRLVELRTISWRPEL